MDGSSYVPLLPSPPSREVILRLGSKGVLREGMKGRMLVRRAV
jgi:hypothetical protein